MKLFRLLLCRFLFVIALVSNAQTTAAKIDYKATDKKITQLKDSINSIAELGQYILKNFETDEQRCRAIFKWITLHVSYDLKSMYSINIKTKSAELATAAFSRRTAICMGYAALFDTLCKLTNLPVVTIPGSTKQDWLPEPTGHVWNAVKISGDWRLVDATWGSGYVDEDDHKFYRKLNNSFFLADGEAFYTTHHPIDAIWQLIDYPHDLYYFYHQSGKKTASQKWNCQDSIEAYLKLPHIEQVITTQRRLKLNGTNSNFTSDYFNFLENQKIVYLNNQHRSVSRLLNSAVDEFNSYINYKNHRFEPALKDEEIGKIFSAADSSLLAGRGILNAIRKYKDGGASESVVDYDAKIAQLEARIKEEKEFVAKYVETPVKKRPKLFLQPLGK